MGIIFIDFYKNLSNTKSNKYSFFSYSLEEQYESLKNRIPIHKTRFNTLQEFVEASFPTGLVKKYYISSSNFKREKVSMANGLQFLNNVVIRPDITTQMKQYLPEKTNVFLIGDIQEGDKLKSFVVKGIEFIDESITSTNDIILTDSYCSHTFSMSSSSYNKPYIQWTLDRPNYELSIFTPDFIAMLIQRCYPMARENLKHVIKMYDNWTEYMDFRTRYLTQQSLRDFKLNHVLFITAYSINKQTYNRNASQYEDDLLVQHEDFKKGEQILLKVQVPDSEETSLIATHIDYNKKKFLADRVPDKRGNLRHPDEKSLRVFSRENVALSKTKPTNESYEKVLKDAFSLEERYKLIFQDIEPNCELVEKQYDLFIQKELKNIIDRYQQIVYQQLSRLKEQEEKRLSDQLEQQIEHFSKGFYREIDNIVNANTDIEVKNQIQKMIELRTKELKQSLKNSIDRLDKKSLTFEVQKSEMQQFNDQLLSNYIDNIDIKQIYIAKHNLEKIELKNKLIKANQQTLLSYEKIKLQELTNKYAQSLALEQDKKKIEIEKLCNDEISKKIENETIRRFSIYFKVNNDDPEKISKIKFSEFSYLIYDNRAEKAKIDRQKRALENFYEGNVKNPYLASYLFAPNELKRNYYDFSDWKWFLESLNDKQKDAVQKAVSSRGIFLLQGPPGTGKTQVIAEIVGHLVQDGKKILVASETHKAIDNVFERLPLLADIRPLRLIANRSGKGSNFGPENLLDNFYENISKNMRKIIRSYEKFGEYREKFLENYQKQKMLNDRIIRNKSNTEKTEKEIKKLASEVDNFRNVKQKENDITDSLLIENDMMIRTRRHLERANLKIEEDIDGKIISDFINESIKMIKKEQSFNVSDPTELIRNILQIDIKVVYEETNAILSSAGEMKNEQEKAQIRQKLSEYKDLYGEWKPNTEEFYKPLQQRLKELINTSSSSFSLEDLKISKIFKADYLAKPIEARDIIERYQEELIDVRIKYILAIDKKIELQEVKIAQQRDKIDYFDSKMVKISDSIRELQNDSDYKSIQEDEARLRREIAKFIEEFGVAIDYKNYTDAIEKIYQAYQDLDTNFMIREEENKKIIPIYKKISEYLTREEVIESDRTEYTKPLFDKANLFGITNTSRESFNEASMEDLSKYNLGSIDLKKQGIDVVIIDEVSKSSFLDLLIPILYGKTVILVGDHRQLPPMYEFRNLRNDDFEHIDEDILTKAKNDKFKQLYEESFFKTLFEQVPNDYKVMLNKQYRSHEHIMQVYNCFYNNQLQLGNKTQNSEKEHHLSIISNNRQIIDPNKHVYFVDCKKFESKETDSTSIYNSNEADVVVQLLKQISDSYKMHPNFKPEITKDKDERMSVGVICTYGDQARVIKQKLKNSKIKLGMFNEKSDSKLIISTVDDFQGDERDIIILSMVRNPQYRAKSDPGFVTAYQRINVALSRARRLLIVVGNRSYLEDKGIIDLPDVNGQGNDYKNYPVYKQVIGQINRYGSIFDDEDVLGGGKL